MPRRPTRPRSAPRAEWVPRTGHSARERATAVAPRPLTLSTRTAAEAAHGAFQDALRDLDGPPSTAADLDGDGDGADTADVAGVAPAGAPEVGPTTWAPDLWAEDGGPLGALTVGAPPGTRADREARAAREFGRERDYERMHAAAGAYARALRREGVELPAALAAVHATVAADAAGLPAGDHVAVQGDAARCCLEAFYPH